MDPIAPPSRSGARAGETITIGGAGLIVAYKHADAGTVEPAVTPAVENVQALKAALADAQKKMAEEGT